MALEDLKTGIDLYDYVMSFGGQPGGANDDYAAQVKAAIRKEYWDLLQRHRWWWAIPQRPATLVIEATQAVTVSSISGAVVNLSSTIATSQTDKKFSLDANDVPYRIASHTAGSNQLTLDAEYAEEQTSGRATIYQDEYLGPTTCLKPWGPMRSRSDWNYIIDIIPYNEFETRFGWGRHTGAGPAGYATIASFAQDAASGRQRHVFRINAVSERRFVAEFQYTQFHNIDFGGSSGDWPLVPEADRWVIAEMALWTLWRNKNNTLADSAHLKAQRKIEAMESTHLAVETRAGFYTRVNHSVGAR